MALLPLVAVGLAGCAGEQAAITATVRQAVGNERIRLAVLPFDNLSQKPGAERAVTQTILTYLLASDLFEVIEPGHVNRVLADLRVRSAAEEIDPETARKLGQRLNAELLLIGVVQEYGEVRVANDVYPAVSLSMRILDVYTGSILWSASAAQTGADTVVIFDFGRITSLPKLTQVLVEKMARGLQASAPRIVEAVKRGREAGLPAAPTPPPPSAPVTVPPPAPQGPLAEAQLKALLRDVSGFTRSEVGYRKHFYDTVEAVYAVEGTRIPVRLVDYASPERAANFMTGEHAGVAPATFANLPAYMWESQFGLVHLDVVAGRFGLYLSGPSGAAANLQRLAQALIAGLQDVR